MLVLWAHIALAADPVCTFHVDDRPTSVLDCERGGAWTVGCALPSVREGKARVRLEFGDLQAEAPVSLRAAQEASVLVPLGGPGNRAGLFAVSEAAGGLLPGQTVGPLQLCPVVQPDVEPGADRARGRLRVTVSSHEHAGFVDEVGPSGVATRVAQYGEGRVHASGEIDVLQRRVGAAAPPDAAPALPHFEEFTGLLQVAGDDGAWRSVAYTALTQALDGPALSTRFDFVAPVIGEVLGGDPVALLEADLVGWLAGDDTPLTLVAWARSEGVVPVEATFAAAQQGGVAWRRASAPDHGLDVRVGRVADRVRVVITVGTFGDGVLRFATEGLR